MSIDKLKKEIREKEQELERLKKEEQLSNRKEIVRELSEFSDEEKIAIFNKLYKEAIDDLIHLEDKGYSDEDSAYYAYESLLEIVAKDKKEYWNYRNSLSKY